MAMEFVGDYNKKKKVAEALRRYQESVAGVDTGPSAYTTGASGAFPGMTQANWGGALAKLGAGFLSGRAGGQADAADTEAQDARMAALKAITDPQMSGAQGSGIAPAGGVGPPDTGTMEPPEVTPEKIAALQELGFDPASMGFKMPDPPALGAEAQAANTKAGRKILVLRGLMSQADADAMDAAEDAATQAGYDQEAELERLKASLKAPKGMTEAEFNKWLYENHRDDWLAKNAKTGGAAGKGGRYDPAREAKNVGGIADKLSLLIETNGDEMFGGVQKAAAGVRRYGEQTPGTILGTIAEASGTAAESPANTIMRGLGIEATLESIAKLAPASDADIRILLSKVPNAYLSKASALELVKEMKALQTRFEAGYYDEKPAAGGGEVDDLVNQYAD